MRISKNVYLIISGIIFLLLMFLAGCVSSGPTKPNPIFQGKLPELTLLEHKNPILEKELRKLPELQDGITSGEAKALKNLGNRCEFI